MPSRSVSYAAIADRYERVRGGDHRAAELADAVLPWLAKGLVCDVGAGTGVVAARLRQGGAELVACDISIEMLGQASSRLPGRLFVGDGTALPLSDRSVGTVLYVWVLHHVGDPEAAVQEAGRALRPGGRLVSVSGIALPVDDDMGPIFERMTDELRPGRRAKASAVTTLGQAAGFRVVHEGIAPTTTSTSPNGLASQIEQRLYAPLWELDEATWARVVDPAISALRALPRPDAARQRVIRHPLVVLEKS